MGVQAAINQVRSIIIKAIMYISYSARQDKNFNTVVVIVVIKQQRQN